MKEKIEEGAYVLLTVKYGLIRLISTKADLCDEVGNVDLKCPLEAGDMEVSKKVDLPAEIPPVSFPRKNSQLNTDDIAGQIHRFGRRIHRRRCSDYMPYCYGLFQPWILLQQRAVMRCMWSFLCTGVARSLDSLVIRLGY